MINNDIVDKRVAKTINHIIESLVTLLKQKSFDQITVKDICSEGKISRTTFYTHFKDKNEFIHKYLNDLLKKGKKDITRKEFSTKTEFFETMLNFWLNEGHIFLLLLADDSAQIAHAEIKKTLQYNIELKIIPIIHTQSLTNKEKYFLLIFMSNAIFGVLQDWSKRGCKETPKEVASIMNHIFTIAFK